MTTLFFSFGLQNGKGASTTMGIGVVAKHCSYNCRTCKSSKEQYKATVCIRIWNSFHRSWSFSIWCLRHDTKHLFQCQSGTSPNNSRVAECTNENGSLRFHDPVSWNQLVLCKQAYWCLEFQRREKDLITMDEEKKPSIHVHVVAI